jgi:hypothetical protein
MEQPTYLDFEVAIEAGADQRYPIHVVRAPGGEARATMQFPFDKTQLAAQLAPIQDALVGAGPYNALQLMRAFGTALFEALLTGDVRSRYDVSRSQAQAQNKNLGLRIKLRILAPEMLGVPWEFLYDPREQEFVCLSRNTPLVRYTEAPQSIRPLIVQPPLRILGMVTNPQGVPALDVEREKQRIEQAVAPLQQQKLVELVWLEGQTWRALQRALQTGAWHIFHYVGHAQFDPGSGEGVLALADEQGQLWPLGATALARLLDDHESLRLAVLNACEGARGDEFPQFSSIAGVLVRRGMPAVIAMQYAITDVAALEFTQSFYEAIANRLPVDAAVAEARKAISIQHPGSLEWATPVLYMRAPDGELWPANQSAKTEGSVSESKDSERGIDTGGGAYIGGSLNVGGDFVGRDKVVHGDEVRGNKIGGDSIVANIGSGAKNVAVGKNITQTITEQVGPPQPDDKPAIEAQLQRLLVALNTASIEPRTAGRAEGYIEDLQGELTKTGKDETPDSNTITKASDWLLKNVPELTTALGELFGMPAVGRILAKTGEATIEWVRQRFGRTANPNAP